jgi:N-acetylmuramoyl-L-alanine amidase
MGIEKTVIWTSANIRSGAGDNYPVVTTVKQGDKLIVLGESGEWFNVRAEGGQQGWINNRVVK